MIYDCFLFYNELELLEIRLNELDGIVDKHVLVESTITFQHAPKRLFYDENKHLFEKFKDKIVHVIVDDAPTTSPWETEFHQRNAILRGLGDCQDDDLVILSDSDEIPSPFAINMYLKSPAKQLRAFKQLFCYYYFNCVINSNWSHAKILPVSLMKTYNDLQKIRDEKAEVLFRGGWHFSYLGGVDRIITKIKSFSHTELNHPFYLDKQRIETCMLSGIDFIMPRQLHIVPFDDRFPAYLRNNAKKFESMIAISLEQRISRHPQ